MSVPNDSNGCPFVKIHAEVKETIPTVQYGNVTLTASVERYVADDGDEAVGEGLSALFVLVEERLGEERQVILGLVVTKVRNVAAGHSRRFVRQRIVQICSGFRSHAERPLICCLRQVRVWVSVLLTLPTNT